MDPNPSMNNKQSTDIQDDSSMNSDPAGFNFDNKKGNSKTMGSQKSGMKRMNDGNPPDPSSAKKSKTVGFKNNHSLMPVTMLTEPHDDED